MAVGSAGFGPDRAWFASFCSSMTRRLEGLLAAFARHRGTARKVPQAALPVMIRNIEFEERQARG